MRNFLGLRFGEFRFVSVLVRNFLGLRSDELRFASVLVRVFFASVLVRLSAFFLISILMLGTRNVAECIDFSINIIIAILLGSRSPLSRSRP